MAARRAHLTRQELLLRKENPLRFWTVIDEAALRRQIGSVSVMRDQYAKLLDFADRDNITIQVLPFAKGAHLGTRGKSRSCNSVNPATRRSCTSKA
ncbi:Scr1 family TA system antitoxin-like transcriptional regulator [Thermopolyspora flexuosa]|uniref:Scr1 family TA system antitoxin-like transcriptional regulator n=1 Tax=Thermopolyspora flexuosa TaxID=103836 RepID=UPI003CC81189